jgi:predicted transcriptional regulator
MPEPQRAERPRPTSDDAERDDAERDDAERERFIAAVEAGLADVAAGRVYSHAQVQAEMRKRFPPPK